MEGGNTYGTILLLSHTGRVVQLLNLSLATETSYITLSLTSFRNFVSAIGETRQWPSSLLSSVHVSVHIPVYGPVHGPVHGPVQSPESSFYSDPVIPPKQLI